MKSRLSKDHLSFIKTFVYNSERLFRELHISDEHSAKLLECQNILAKIYPVAENAALDLNIGLGTDIPLQEVPDNVLDRSGAFYALTKELVAVVNENPDFKNVPVQFGLGTAEEFMDDVSQSEVIAAGLEKSDALKSLEYIKASVVVVKERSQRSWSRYKDEVYSALDSSDTNIRLARAISNEVEYMFTPEMYDAMALDALFNSVMSLAENKRPVTVEQIENEITSQLKMQYNEKARYRQIIHNTPDLYNLHRIVREAQHRCFENKILCNNCELAAEGLGRADKSFRVRKLLLQEAAHYGCEGALPAYLYQNSELKLPPRWKKYEENLHIADDAEILTGIQMLASQWAEVTAQKVTRLRQEFNGLNDENITPEQQRQFFDEMIAISKDILRVSKATNKYLGINLNPLGATFRHLKEFASSSLSPKMNSYKFFDKLLNNFGTGYKNNLSQFAEYKTDIDHLEYINRLAAQPPSLERRNIYFYSSLAYQALYDDATENAEKDKIDSLEMIKGKHPALSERLIEFAECLDLPNGTDAKRIGNDIDNAVSEYFLMPLYMREKPQEDAFEQALDDVGGYHNFDAVQQKSIETLMQYHLKESVAFHKSYIRQNDDAKIIRSAVEEKEYNHLFSQGYAMSLMLISSGYESEQENYRQYKEAKTKAYYNQQQDNSVAFLLRKIQSGRK